MSFLSSWRSAIRIARREARRSKGRSALVILMICLPVAGLAMFASMYDMFTLTAEERADRTFGQADARIQWQWHVPIIQNGNTGEFGLQYRPADGFDRKLQEGSGPEAKPGTLPELIAALPAGSKAYELSEGGVGLRTGAGVGSIGAVAVDASTGLADGLLTILDGRAPTSGSEVALTAQAMERVGAKIGATVTSADGLRTYTVVGEFENPDQLGEQALFAPSATPAFTINSTSWLVTTPAPLQWEQITQLNKLGIAVDSRSIFLNPPPASGTTWDSYSGYTDPQEAAFTGLIAGLALLEIVLMAGPAFAVSARRRQRQLALVAANGGTPAHVRRIVLADGVVLGLVGAAVGIVLGIAAAFLGRPLVEVYLANARAGGYRVFPLALLAIVALAIVTGVLAALVPAFITARQNVVASLAGRRGITRSRKRWLVLGLVGVAAGSAIVLYGTQEVSTTVMLAGMIVGELGLVLCTPALVGLIARMGRILPLAPRIALRDAARNRAAAAPAISAVMAAVAGSVALGLFFDSDRAQQEALYRPSAPTGYVHAYLPQAMPDPKPGGESIPVASPAEIERALRKTLPITATYLVRSPACASAVTDHWCEVFPVVAESKRCPYGDALTSGRPLTKDEMRAARKDDRCASAWDAGNSFNGSTTVDDGSGLGLFTAASGEDLEAAIATLRAGGVVVGNEKLIDNGKASLLLINIDTAKNMNVDPFADAPHKEYPAYLLRTGVLQGAVVSPSVIEALGYGQRTTDMIAATSRVPTQDEEDRMNAALQALQANAYIERGAVLRFDERLLILMGAAALITIAAAGVGTGLAAADGRADLSTLASVGASPRMRRGLSLSQSGVIAGLGSLLGAAAGLGAAFAVMTALNLGYADIWPGPAPTPPRVPWLSLAVALVIVPAISMLGAGMLTRSRLPIERRL